MRPLLVIEDVHFSEETGDAASEFGCFFFAGAAAEARGVVVVEGWEGGEVEDGFYGGEGVGWWGWCERVGW